MNINKALIYIWKYKGNVVYVGRTIKSLNERIQGHKRDYLKQKELGLVTKKFIKISELPNEWDDLEFEVVEVVEGHMIDSLGERELFWYQFYSSSNQLWNSIRPDRTDYLSLSLEDRYERRKLKDFEKFTESQLRRLSDQIIIKYYERVFETLITPINPSEFQINLVDSLVDTREIYLSVLETHSKEKYFRALLGWIVNNADKHINFYNYRIGGLGYFYPEITDLFYDLEFLIEIYERLEKVELVDLEAHWSEKGIYKYISKQEKVERYGLLKTALVSFENTIKKEVNLVIGYVKSDLYSYENAFGQLVKVEDEAFELDEYEMILIRNIAAFNNEHPFFKNELHTFINASSIRGYDGDFIRSDYFINQYGKALIDEILYCNFTDRNEKVIPKGYDLYYLEEVRGYSELLIRAKLDYNSFKPKEVYYNVIHVIPSYLQDDYDFVRKAVSVDGHYLKYASERLRKNKEIVNIAVENRPESIQFASIEIKK